MIHFNENSYQILQKDWAKKLDFTTSCRWSSACTRCYTNSKKSIIYTLSLKEIPTCILHLGNLPLFIRCISTWFEHTRESTDSWWLLGPKKESSNSVDRIIEIIIVVLLNAYQHTYWFRFKCYIRVLVAWIGYSVCTYMMFLHIRCVQASRHTFWVKKSPGTVKKAHTVHLWCCCVCCSCVFWGSRGSFGSVLLVQF